VLDSPEVGAEPFSAENTPQLLGFSVRLSRPAESIKDHTAEAAQLPADERSCEQRYGEDQGEEDEPISQLIHHDAS
jgi:hypothetical protein